MTVSTASAVEHAASYPTSGSLTVDATGVQALVVLLYTNATWAGPAPSVTFGATPLTQVTRYDSTASGYQTVFLFVLTNPTQTSAALAYSQSAGTYNSERHLVVFGITGLDTAAPISAYAGVTRAANSGTFTTALSAVAANSLVLVAGYGYYLNSAPTVTGGSHTYTERSALTTGSAAKSRSYSAAASGEVSAIWSCDSWNYAMGFILAVKPSGGGAPPSEPTVRWVYYTDGAQKAVTMKVWNGSALVDPSGYAKVE
jgi:hypothetical protein